MRVNSLYKFARNKSAGFTLIEVIIAMAIFAILATLSYAGLQSVIDSKTDTEASLERLQQLQMSMLSISNDIQQLSNRDGHDALGGLLNKLSTQNSDFIVSFTRSGWRNPASQKRSTLQRAAYYLDEDRLIRIYWPYVDRASDEQRIERVLINNIESFEVRFLDNKNQWQDNWPTANALSSSAPVDLPVAVEVTLKMHDWGEIKRLIRVSL